MHDFFHISITALMNSNLKDPKLTYALNSEGRMVSVGTVLNGKACNCICPGCKQTLIACNNERNIRQAHFKHEGENNTSTSNHSSCYMAALHYLAEQIIRDHKEVMAPVYKDIIEAHTISFREVKLEEYDKSSQTKPDIIGETESGHECYIEIRNTNPIRINKRNKIIDSGRICMEIDVRGESLDDLEDFLLKSSKHRRWIHNPVYEQYIRSKEANNKVVQLPQFAAYSEIDRYHDMLKPGASFDNEKGLDTEIVNFGKTTSGNGIVVWHNTRNVPYECYLTLVTFQNGQPILQTMKPLTDQLETEKRFCEFKEKY